MLPENSASNALSSKNKKGNETLKHLLSSEECVEYFKSLSKITGFDLSIYDEKGNHILTTKENPICRLFKSDLPNTNECPGSCKKPMFESLKLNEPITYRCYSKVMNFSIPLNYLKEKAVLVGRNGFTSYEDFLEFLKIAKKIYLHTTSTITH
ncbi:MAG: PocR ligand-binding domain-containing protein, partial [Candidatus Mariimomonas ferrooxydans]